tara:strand:- start:913 stop:2070 length:1158 start_codon:yes stop_codon:yes gene_type:complete
MKSFTTFLTEKTLLLELDHLYKVFNKKGKEFLDDILNNKVYINLKIDTSSMIVKKESTGLKYYNREMKQEIDKVVRAGSDIREKFIDHLETTNWSKLPNDIIIATEIYNPKISTIIKWDKAPRNGMIISWIKLGGKSLPLNDPLYDKVSDILEITPPPVIHSGLLNTKQKDLINKLVENPDIISGAGFASEMLSVFTLKPAHAYLAGNFIEGIVIYTESGQVYKLTDTMFTVTNMDKNGDKSNDFYELISGTAYNNLDTAINSILNNKLSMKKVMAFSNKESRYIQFISALTGSIIAKVARDMGKVEEYKASVEENRYSSVSAALIPTGMNKLIKKYWYAEDLFRILLYGIRKEKTRIHKPSGLTLDRKNIINKAVAQLKELEIL